MEIQENRHSVYKLQYHLVVVTKYRKEIINDKIKDELTDIAINIFENSYNGTIIEINIDKDHIHILFSVGPQVQLSKAINSFKTVSSRLVRKNNADYLNAFYRKPYFWSKSYYIGSVGNVNEETIIKYIQNQGEKAHNPS